MIQRCLECTRVPSSVRRTQRTSKCIVFRHESHKKALNSLKSSNTRKRLKVKMHRENIVVCRVVGGELAIEPCQMRGTWLKRYVPVASGNATSGSPLEPTAQERSKSRRGQLISTLRIYPNLT